MHHPIRVPPTLVALSLVAALACSGGGGYGSPSAPSNNSPPPPNAVTVVNNAFTPAATTVAVGTRVTWTWNTCSGGDGYGGGQQTCVAHDIVFDDGAPGSGVQSSGTFGRTFSAAGTFPYHCSIHGTAMSGKVTVQ